MAHRKTAQNEMSFVENILMYPFITQPLSEGKTKDGKTIKIQEAWAVKCQDGGEKSGKLTNSGKLTKKKKIPIPSNLQFAIKIPDKAVSQIS